MSADSKSRDLDDPTSLFIFQIDKIKSRIRTLEKDLKKVQHYYSKAIIEKELEVLVDDLIARQLSLQSKEE